MKLKNKNIEIKSQGKEWYVNVDGINVSVKHHRVFEDIYEPYKKQEDISNKLNPFTETD